MGTRGALGVRINGQDKISYNHFDSYPSGLGKDVVDVIRVLSKRGNLKELAEELVVIDGQTPPTEEQIERLAPWTDLNVSEKSTSDWYCLLRNTQGDLGAILEAGIIKDHSDFLRNSLFCEYAYIVNLDSDKFEVYDGCAKEPNKGRYIGEQDEHGYYPVSLVGEYDLTNIPDDWIKQSFPSDEDE